MGQEVILSEPEPLSSHHEIDAFDSGERVLDDWLTQRAMGNQLSGASRTYVVCLERRVIGFYSLNTGAVANGIAPGRFRRNIPNPIPVIILGRLAIDRSQQGRGLGRALFRDAAIRVVQAAEIVGVRGLLVHAISDDAKAFYVRLGLAESPANPLTLMITIADLNAALA